MPVNISLFRKVISNLGQIFVIKARKAIVIKMEEIMKMLYLFAKLKKPKVNPISKYMLIFYLGISMQLMVSVKANSFLII